MNESSALIQAVSALPLEAGPSLRMQDLMDPALAALPGMLEERGRWRSLFIDYEPPFLMRLFTEVAAKSPADGQPRKVYISAHHFFGAPGKDGPAHDFGIANPYAQQPDLATAESKNNYHPHPWASTFQLLAGSYRQRVGLAAAFGYSADPASPLRPVPYAMWEQDANDPAKSRYTFNDPLAWHCVLPNDGAPVSTIMITYMPQNWNQTGPRPAQKQRALDDRETEFMFRHIAGLLPPQPSGKAPLPKLSVS